MVFRFVDSDFWLLNLYHKVKIKVTQRCYSWLNIYVFYHNPQGELFKVWMIFRFVDSDLWKMNLYHKHKRDTEISVLNEYEFNMNCYYMFFKGSNFYLQITHWYDYSSMNWCYTLFQGVSRKFSSKWTLIWLY